MRDRPLDYEFAPLPRRDVLAMRGGQRERTKMAIVAVICDRMNRATKQATATRAWIVEAIGWEHEAESVAKLIRELRDEGRLAYEYDAKANRYHFTLLPKGSPPSERRPTPPAETRPTPTSPRGQLSKADSPADSSNRSDPSEAHKGRTHPTPPLSDPTPLRPANPKPEPDSGGENEEPVRPLQSGQRENACSKGEALGASALATNYEADVGEGTGFALIEDGLQRVREAHDQLARRRGAVALTKDGRLEWRDPKQEGEAGILADAQALVDAGLAVWSFPSAGDTE